MRKFLTIAAALAFSSGLAVVVLLFLDWYVHDGTPNQRKLEACEEQLRAAEPCCDAELDQEVELHRCENRRAELFRNCQCPWSPTVLESLEVPR